MDTEERLQQWLGGTQFLIFPPPAHLLDSCGLCITAVATVFGVVGNSSVHPHRQPRKVAR
jgi:hypothetical protein